MIKAKIIRGVYIRGKAYAEGEVVEVSTQEFQELKSAYQAILAPEKEEAAPKKKEQESK